MLERSWRKRESSYTVGANLSLSWLVRCGFKAFILGLFLKADTANRRSQGSFPAHSSVDGAKEHQILDRQAMGDVEKRHQQRNSGEGQGRSRTKDMQLGYESE